MVNAIPLVRDHLVCLFIKQALGKFICLWNNQSFHYMHKIPMNPHKNSLKWCWLSLFIVLLDQSSKYAIMHFLALYESYPIFPFFNLTLTYNTGAAFSFLSEQPVLAFWAFTSIALIMSVVILIWLYRLPANRPWSACAFALVLGGALGNVIDRFVHGYVIDFLDFYYQGWHFAAFNLADSAICVGAGMLFLEMFLYRSKS